MVAIIILNIPISFFDMILFKNHLVELNYEVKNDILTVIWPDLKQDDVIELEYVLTTIIDTISHYDIKRLLIDSGKAVVEIEEPTYRALIFKFVQRLAFTRLKKMARIISESTVRENRLKGYAQEMEVQRMFTFVNGEFENKQRAIDWLLKNE